MPRGRGKGGKNRKKGKAMQAKERRELEFKQEGQEYGQALKLLGSGRVSVYCMDGKNRIATIRGSMKQRVWINNGDIVLLGLRDFGTDEKCDIIMKYFIEEAQELKELGELPDHIELNEGVGGFGGEEAGEMEGEYDDEEEEKKEELDINKIWVPLFYLTPRK